MPKEDKEADEPEEKKGEGGKGEEGGEGEAGLEPPKKNNKKKLILIGAVAGVLLLGGGGAGLFFSGVLGGSKPAVEGKEAAAEHGGEAKPASEDAHGAKKEGEGAESGAPVFYSLGDILVNLAGDGKKQNFLKIKVSLELTSEKDKEAMDALKPRIVDNFQVYLRELRVEDLRGSAGLYRLREELLLRVTEAAQPIRVKDVLFQEMLVQ